MSISFSKFSQISLVNLTASSSSTEPFFLTQTTCLIPHLWNMRPTNSDWQAATITRFILETLPAIIFLSSFSLTNSPSPLSFSRRRNAPYFCINGFSLPRVYSLFSIPWQEMCKIFGPFARSSPKFALVATILLKYTSLSEACIAILIFLTSSLKCS